MQEFSDEEEEDQDLMLESFDKSKNDGEKWNVDQTDAIIGNSEEGIHDLVNKND